MIEQTVFWMGSGTAQISVTRPRPDGMHEHVSTEARSFPSKADAIAYARQIGAVFTA